MSVTLGAEDAETLQWFMESANHFTPGEAASRVLRFAMRTIREVGGPENYLRNRLREQEEYQAKHSTRRLGSQAAIPPPSSTEGGRLLRFPVRTAPAE